MTNWRIKIYFFIRASDATVANKNVIVSILVDNGSMETLANELKMFDRPVKLSISGELPVQAFGFLMPAKPAMGDELKNLLQSLNNARYAIVSNIADGTYQEGELILTNMAGVIPSGQIFTWENALQAVFDEFGLIVIPPDTEI